MGGLIALPHPGRGSVRVRGLVMSNMPFSAPAHYPLGLLQALGWFVHFDR